MGDVTCIIIYHGETYIDGRAPEKLEDKINLTEVYSPGLITNEKSGLHAEELTFLEYKITKHGFQSDDKLVKISENRRGLQYGNSYGQFIPYYSLWVCLR